MPQLLDKYPYFKRLPTLAPVCAIILAGLLLHSSAFSATPPTEESGLHISVQYSFPIACNTYGASITIYENIFPNQGAPDKSKAADIDYYYCPHPIIDLVQMRKDFNALTPPTSNQKPDMSYSLPIHVDFLMDQVETELVAALSAKFNTAIPKSKIARLAFRGYEIFATIGGEEIVPYKIPLSLRGDPNTTFQDNLPYHVDFIITST